MQRISIDSKRQVAQFRGPSAVRRKRVVSTAIISPCYVPPRLRAFGARLDAHVDPPLPLIASEDGEKEGGGAPSESDSDAAFNVQVLYTSVPGAIECDGPAVRRKMHALSCPVVLNETSGLTWTSLQDARRGLRTLGRTAGIGPLFPDPTFLSVPRRGLTRGLANDVKRGPRARRRRRPRRCPRR